MDVNIFNFSLARPHIKKFRTAVDIGCRFGDATIPLLSDFEKIYCFDYQDVLRIESKKIIFKKLAIGDKVEKVRASGGVITDLRDKKVKYVDQIKLDDLEIKYIDYIKIDTEGHEKKVLLGALKTIKKYYPVIQMENTDEQVKWGKGKSNDAEEFLFSLGYKKVNYRYKYKDFIYLHPNNKKLLIIRVLELLLKRILEYISKI